MTDQTAQPADLPDPTFPPLLTGHAVEDGVEPLATARELAISKAAGAGDVFWSRRTDRLQCAIVLEPEVVAGECLHMAFAAMLAFGDAFGAVAPPEVGMSYRWPGTFLVNDGYIGKLQVALPEQVTPHTIPDWLVVAIDIAIFADAGAQDPGFNLENTTLYEEGCGEVTRSSLIDSYCRHFLVWVDEWSDGGFEPLHRRWLQRTRDHNAEISLDTPRGERTGTFVGLDDLGNLLLRESDGPVASLSLAEALASELEAGSGR